LRAYLRVVRGAVGRLGFRESSRELFRGTRGTPS
jgi:hypothetical protein